MDELKHRKLWLNVTLSHTWAQPPLGLVRVETELVRILTERLGPTLRLCVWTGDSFTEVSISDYRSGAPSEKPGGPPEAWMIASLPRKEALSSLVRGAYSLLPRALRRFLYPAGRHSISKLRKVRAAIVPRAANIVRGVSSNIDAGPQLHQNGSFPKPGTFSPGDVFFSCGNDWGRGFDEHIFFEKQGHGIRVVRFLHDLIPVLFPHLAAPGVSWKFFDHLVDLSYGTDLLICNSRSTQVDAERVFKGIGAPMPKMTVVRLGDSAGFLQRALTDAPSTHVRLLAEQPFILYVSTVERRKNHETVYRAYRQLISSETDVSLPHLIFVGQRGWNVGDFLGDIAQDPLVQGRIHWISNATDSELAFLYENCLFTVYPSVYEGWGLPIAEAFAFGKPAIVSRVASIPELAGDLAIYLDPYDVTGWAEEMLHLVQDSEYRKECERRIIDQYRPYEWRETGDTLLSAIRPLLVSENDQ